MQLLRWLLTSDAGDRAYYKVDPYDLISILLETMSYGMFLVLFLLSMVLLLQRRRAILPEKGVEPAKLNCIVFYLVMSTLMFLAITAKWCFWWAEIFPIPGYDGSGEASRLPRLSRNAYRLKEVCIQITILLGDMITIYRLWILSARSKTMIIFPIAGLLGYLACAIGLSGPANDTNETPLPLLDAKVRLTDWDIAAISITVGITVYVTTMITWIITRPRLHSEVQVLGRGLKRALALIVESAALYTIWNMFFFITGLGPRSEIALCFLDCMPAVYGISVMLINVRVGLGWAMSYDGAPARNGVGVACMSSRKRTKLDLVSQYSSANTNKPVAMIHGPGRPLLRRDDVPQIGDQAFYRVDPYDLISILLETLSYGIFLVLFVLSTALLLRRRKACLRDPMVESLQLRGLMFYLVTGLLMFLFITAKWTFWWAEVLPINAGSGIVAQLPRLNRTAYRFREVCMQCTVLLGDMITIYRLWILSNRRKLIIVVPVLGFFGFLASAIGLSGPANDTSSTPIPITNGKLELSDWDVAAMGCTVSITVYVTLMIGWILLRARLRAGALVFGQGVKRALAIVVESAAIYTVWCLVFLIAGLGFQSEIGLSFLDPFADIYGISVMLINVRVGLGWARNGESIASSAVHSQNMGRNIPLSTNPRGIHISTVVYTETSAPSRLDGARTQRRATIELGDGGSVASSVIPSGKLYEV
ncbi:hypothetical protein NP233_g263 [Leucocoprinus birnbaumii]|uniref:Uncharacterized protein n=1 Tax=Leucocoprinus birnbaumii TaxID=56174 RepID=A0AAD5W4C2_9AGAR|nr:hypothetical protein NP233_g263 [Leucocoprinus birnbaumii]